MSRPKLLIAATEFPPYPYGVSVLTARQAVALAQEPAGSGDGGGGAFDVTVMTPELADEGWVEPPGVRVLRFAGSKRPIWRIFPYRIKMRDHMKQDRPDIMFCPQYRGFGPVVQSLGLRFGVPYVAYIHGTELLTERGRFLRSAMAKGYLRMAAATICNSRYSAALATEMAQSSKFSPIVVPPMVETDTFAMAARAPEVRQQQRGAMGISETRSVVVTVGRIDERKGYDVLAEAMRILMRRSPSRALDWWIVGDGEKREELFARLKEWTGADPTPADKAAEGIPPTGFRAVWWGRKPSGDIPAILAASDVFALTSVDHPKSVESFGMVYIEANAAGLPVVAARTGGVEDAVEDEVSGFLVPSKDSEAAAIAIERLLNSAELRRELGAQGAVRAKQLCHPAVVGARLRTILHDVLGR